MNPVKLIFALALLTASALTYAGEKPGVYFITPQDGETVSGEFTIQFGLRGMGVAPAGVEKDNTGHHHLLIDVDTLPAMDMPLPSTDHVRHFGGGQTETSIKLTPGKHTLQLVLGNYAHIPHAEPVMSEKITVIVAQ